MVIVFLILLIIPLVDQLINSILERVNSTFSDQHNQDQIDQILENCIFNWSELKTDNKSSVTPELIDISGGENSSTGEITDSLIPSTLKPIEPEPTGIN